MDESLAREVRRRAGYACEYCRVPQACYPTVPFPIDHVIARSMTERPFSHLALSCLHCNAHKGPNIAGIDPVSRRLTALFNPRRHKWARHFRWAGAIIAGRTAIGRTTVVVLAMNDGEAVNVREMLLNEGRLQSAD